MIGPLPKPVVVAVCDHAETRADGTRRPCPSLVVLPEIPNSNRLPLTMLRVVYKWEIRADGSTYCPTHAEPTADLDDDEWWTAIREDQLEAPRPVRDPFAFGRTPRP